MIAYTRSAIPTPGEKVARKAGRKWNAGDTLMCGMRQGLLVGYILAKLFLRIESNIATRIPLPPPVCALGAPSPRERGKRRRRETILYLLSPLG